MFFSGEDSGAAGKGRVDGPACDDEEGDDGLGGGMLGLERESGRLKGLDATVVDERPLMLKLWVIWVMKLTKNTSESSRRVLCGLRRLGHVLVWSVE